MTAAGQGTATNTDTPTQDKRLVVENNKVGRRGVTSGSVLRRIADSITKYRRPIVDDDDIAGP